jgi:hypothetical protein
MRIVAVIRSSAGAHLVVTQNHRSDMLDVGHPEFGGVHGGQIG